MSRIFPGEAAAEIESLDETIVSSARGEIAKSGACKDRDVRTRRILWSNKLFLPPSPLSPSIGNIRSVSILRVSITTPTRSPLFPCPASNGVDGITSPKRRPITLIPSASFHLATRHYVIAIKFSLGNEPQLRVIGMLSLCRIGIRSARSLSHT